MNLAVQPVDDFLRLDGLTVVKVDDESYPDEVFVYAKGTRSCRTCIKCKEPGAKLDKHGTDEQRYKDASAFGKKVTILIDRQRYRCQGCRQTFFEPIEALDARRQMTGRLKAHIVKRCFQSPNLVVAREIGIDEGTIRNVFADHVAHLQKTVTFATPEILGIDEIHLSEPRCVLTNIGERTMFDILPSRTQASLAPYFDALADKGNVKAVVADMWAPYHRIAARYLPGRPVIVDRFHVIRMANNGLDIVRKKVGRTRTHEERIRLKDERFLLYRRRMTLTDKERGRVDAWLKAFPLLKEAYRIRERFFDVYDEPDRKAGQKALEGCIQSIHSSMDPYFAEMITACGNWKAQILNYFDLRVTNGYTEGMNAIVREVDRLGRGYSFDVMRARMLYDDEVRSKKTSTRSRRPAQQDDVYGMVDLMKLDVGDFGGLFGRLAASTIEYGADLDKVAVMLARMSPPGEDEGPTG